MKKLFNILIFSFAVITANAQAQPAGCCPKFSLATNLIHPCDDNACKGNPVDPNGGGAGGTAQSLVGCKNQPQTYYVVPALPGFTFTWTVLGGTPTNPTGNPVTINWGNSNQGFLQVIISNANGSCRDTITRKICLLDGPTAAIAYSPNPVCAGSPVNFSGAGSIGATNYYWEFGDGTSSTLQNPPPHIYSGSGIYTVVLTVSTVVMGPNGTIRDCGCKDTAKVIINVLNKKGIDIHTDDCRKMLCTGDTVKYCTSTTGCTGLTWSVSGGTIQSGQGTSCITVVWDQPSVFPTSVTLTASSCPASVCGNTATLNVPILYPNLPIQGPLNVCPGSNTSYSLPALPGTFYYWTLGSGGTIAGYDSNHNVINVTWGSIIGGPHKLICRYTNPYSGCSGADTIDIYIKPVYNLFGLSPVCVGQTTSICANGAVLTWTHLPNIGFTVNSTTATCKNITWNTSGNYSITVTPVTPANFCSSPALLNVVVLDTPKINTIAGPLVVCPGQTVMYSITSNMNAGTFNWAVTNGTITQYMGAHNDSVLVQFTGNGTISVSQTVNNCSSYTQVVNVTVITGIGTITGNSPTCIDAIETYTIAGPVPPGGYTWTLSNALGSIITTTANSITIQWNGAGPSATCVITATACSQSATKTITVNNPPNGTITATGNLCTTGVTLTTSLSMPSYDWYKNGVFYSNTAVNNINVTTPGFYKVKSPTPCYGSATINVPNTFTSNVSITANNVTVFCPGDPINVTFVATVQANNTCTYSYQWYNGVTPIGTNSPSYTATTVGSYYVVISCGNCKDTSNVINVTIGNCSGGCNIYDPRKVIGNDIGGPGYETADPDAEAPLTYSININPPVASPCNVVTFSANYSFTAPHSPNSGVFWNFGDGFGTTSSWAGMAGTSTASPHTYTTPGIYVVSALMYSNCPPPPTPHICPVLDTIHYVVPVAANFGYNVNCKVITLSDLSTTLPSLGCNILSWAWTVSGPAGATFNNAATQNPILTVTQSGTYNITLTVVSNCSGCSATITYPVTITLPSATFTPPSPICALTAAPFSVTNTPGFSYNWNFGDGYQSNSASTNHAFAAPPPSTSIVTLTVTDAMGCTATSSQTVTILPPLTVSIPTDKYICPGASFTLTTTPASFTNYQWYFNGNPITGATSPTFNASNIGEYYVIVNNGPGCIAKSNKMHIWHHPKPIADIKGQTIQCITGGTGNIYLYNAITDPNYTFLWTVNPAATFSPNNTQYDANVTVNATGTYQFILTVTNIVTGCIAKDTFCVYVYNNPSVAIGPTGYLCEGIMHTYNVISPNINYVYQWNNGITGTSMTTAQAGNYYVTVLDPATGCNAQSNMVTIKPRPYVALFPIGCDTLCDTVKLIPPLPLGPGQNYNGVYVIQWYVDGNYHSTGPVLNLNVLSLGQHQIYIVVNFIGDTCAATSGKYDLFIKHCGDCDCKESHWGETKLAEGEKPPAAKNNAKANIPPVVIGNPIILNCGVAQKLDCNKTYTINSSYICKDSACAGKVTFSLQPPSGSPITGTNTITFTSSQTGVYILTMYGWCGNKICDSCVIDLIVDCKKCDCKGSKWGEKTYTIDKATKSFNCDKNKAIDVKCKQPITVNANYICADPTCNAAVTYSLQPPTGLPSTGTLPLTFIPNQSGTYTVTMYGWCGTTLCDSCVIKFKTVCIEDTTCCPYEIKAEPGQPTYAAGINSTIVSNNFAISIPAIANITEVRANVVSYTITDNFNKECMKCVNLPFTWASVSTATNINTAPPKITMYGGTTVLSFNGSGTGAYQNPREIIWNNATNLNSTNITNIGMSFILPPTPAIDCCELKGRICVKFIFRDNDCKECEVIACFDFVIKKK